VTANRPKAVRPSTEIVQYDFQAVIRALTYPTTAYKEGFVPSGALNWNDADDTTLFTPSRS
jgi:hypothetical protein